MKVTIYVVADPHMRRLYATAHEARKHMTATSVCNKLEVNVPHHALPQIICEVLNGYKGVALNLAGCTLRVVEPNVYEGYQGELSKPEALPYLTYRLRDDGSFVCGDNKTRRTAYAYPTSENAVAAKQSPLVVAAQMLVRANKQTASPEIVRETDERNWRLLRE